MSTRLILEASMIVCSTMLLPRGKNRTKFRDPKASLRAQLCWNEEALPAQQGNGDFVWITGAFSYGYLRKASLGIGLNSDWIYEVQGDSNIDRTANARPVENKSHTAHRSRSFCRLPQFSSICVDLSQYVYGCNVIKG